MGFSKLMIFLIGIYFVIFEFVFLLIRNCMLCAPFCTMLCTCLVKTLYGINYNNNNSPIFRHASTGEHNKK